jgi:hypothetical protein
VRSGAANRNRSYELNGIGSSEGCHVVGEIPDWLTESIGNLPGVEFLVPDFAQDSKAEWMAHARSRVAVA